MPNRGSYTDSGRITYRPGKAGFIGTAGKDGVLGGQEGEAFNPTSKYSISDEPAFVPKPTFRINQANDDASGLGYKGALREDSKLHDSVHCVNNSVRQMDGQNFACKNNKWLGPLGGDGVFVRGADEKSGVIIGDNHFIGEAGKDSALGPDVVTTLEHGPGIASQPKSVQLKFINGVWTEDLQYDLHNLMSPQQMPGDYTLKSPNPL